MGICSSTSCAENRSAVMFTLFSVLGSRDSRSVFRYQKLQLVTIGVVEITAMWIIVAAVDFDAGVFQCCLDALVVARHELQRHVIDFAAAVNFRAVFGFE